MHLLSMHKAYAIKSAASIYNVIYLMSFPKIETTVLY